MKSKNQFTAFLVAGSLLLPISALAQSGTSTGSNPNRSNQGQHQGSNANSGSGQNQTSNSRQTGMHASMSGDVKRVSEDKMEDKITAEHLQGKKLVDRDGQKIGEVKHVGLSQVLRDSGKDRSGAGSMNVSASLPGIGSASAGNQVNLYIELDDEVGLEGDDLASIPASQVRFDKDKDELTLQIGRQEFANQLRQQSQISSASE